MENSHDIFELLPGHECSLCKRLQDFRTANREKFPEKYNSPVPSFGKKDAQLLIVGLAPGLKGANFTGRPFTGDFAGILLYETLLKFGFASGTYEETRDDGLELINARITNAVKCVPPENKPLGEEINNCRKFLKQEIDTMPKLRVIISLGLVSHNAVIKTAGLKLSANKFEHGKQHILKENLTLIDSYHCSRYNTNTGRLTPQMFYDIFSMAKSML